MKRLYITLSMIVATSVAAFSLSLKVNPGELSGHISELSPSITDIVVSGSIDARDLGAMRELPPTLKMLNLQDVKIVAYEGEVKAFPGRTLFAASELPDQLFFKSRLESLRLPSDARKIGVGLCSNSELKEVIVPSGVEEIGDFAFYGCQMLESLRLPSSLTGVGKMAFSNCPRLTSLNLASTAITTLPDGCMSGSTTLSAVDLPSGLSTLGSEVFSGTAITTLDLKNLKTASPYALVGMPKLKKVILNKDARVGEGMLSSNASLLEVSQAPVRIPDLFLANSGGVSVAGMIQEAESLGDYSFTRVAVDSLVLSSDLERVGKGAFYNVSGLEYIDARSLGGDIPEVDEEAFKSLSQSSIVLHVNKDYVEDWKNHPQWGLFNVEAASASVDNLTEESNGIDVRLSGGILRVKASSPVSECRIFSLDGTQRHFTSSSRNELELSLEEFPEGAMVVVVRTADGESRNVKILK